MALIYLNHSKAELKKKSKSALVVIGHAILKRLLKVVELRKLKLNGVIHL